MIATNVTTIGRCARVGMTALLATVGLCGTAFAQNYPTRPIEMTVGWGPGGGADVAGRTLARLLEPEIKVSIPVENVAGATGVTGLLKMINSQAEGYQIAIVTVDTYGLLNTPGQRWSMRDVIPLAVLTQQRSGYFVKEDSPLKTWADVEKAAAGNALKVALTGLGSSEDVVTMTVAKRRNLKLTSVPYARPGERYAAAIGGHVDLLYEQAGDIKGFIESKQLRPILFLANERGAPFENVQISKEIGLDLVADQFRTVAIKGGTPPDRVKFLEAGIAKVTASDEYKKYLIDQWADPKSVLLGESAISYISQEVETLGRLMK
ncbi:MAG: tripartite tricarboxylate transporter substrate binding protein [Rhodospirillales bacterium]|nr:tripartite tricarboxylate transporter substrate binding protein [Rhodospirillales bacterium]